MSEPISFQTLVKFSLLMIGCLCVATYIVFQARFLIIGPQITLAAELSQLQNQRLVHVSGSAFNISRLWLNDRQIYTDAQGNFTEALVLENGYTMATLRAEDRYGRTTTLKRPLVYIPASFVSVETGDMGAAGG